MNRTIVIRAAIVSVVAACVGCPASLEDPGRFTDALGGPCPDVPRGRLHQGSLDGGSATRRSTRCWASTSSRRTSRRASSAYRPWEAPACSIDPSSPSTSILYTKLTATPPFGARMPFGEAPLPDATVACVLQWITLQVTDAGSEDAAPPEEASVDDGPPVDDASPAPVEDAASEDATAPILDAGKPQDARAPGEGRRPARASSRCARVRDASRRRPPTRRRTRLTLGEVRLGGGGSLKTPRRQLNE